jgi:hypothetical protein
MASMFRALGISKKKDSNQATPVSASLESLGIRPPPNDTPKLDTSSLANESITTDLSGYSSGPPSYMDSTSGSSYGTTGTSLTPFSLAPSSKGGPKPSASSSTQEEAEPSASQQPADEKVNFDADIFVNLRREPVAKLTGRVKDISIRPIFEGVYSNVRIGMLDGTQKVSGQLLARFFLRGFAGRN